MKRSVLGFAPFVFVALSMACLAQARPSNGRSLGGTTTVAPPTNNTSPSLSLPTVFISGKVALDDGTQLSDPAAIQVICKGRRHTETYTDRHGGFSFQFGDPSPTSGTDFTDASNSMITRGESVSQQRNWQECEVQAVLAGFTSEIVELSSRMSTLESTDIGRLMLHRMAQVEGTSISVTSAIAPDNARKALEKGREQEKKNKPEDALKSFQKAVEIYPKYAVAWCELGALQLQQKDAASAKKSFESSVAADPKFVNPYNGLAQLAYMANQWTEVVKVTDQLLALNPVNFPAAYLFNGVANFYLQNLEASEKSARRGIRVDEGHQVPKLQYLLGLVLMRKQDYTQAAEHLQLYLKMATQPSDIEAAQKQLDQIARLSATPSSAATVSK